MKQLVQKLAIGLLLTNGLTYAEQKPVDLDCGLLSFVDGTEYIGIAEIFSFAGNIIGLMHGMHVKTALKLQEIYKLNLPEPLEDYADPKGRVGLTWFKNDYTDIKALLEYEAENPDDADLADALERTCHHFEKFSEDYVAEIEAAKDIMVKIIANWSELREKPESLLLNWSQVEGKERDSLYKTMTTFAIFDSFLEDLLLFLKDLVQNCPKSHKMYREQLHKQQK